MTAIAGIAAPNAGERVQHMLAQMAHRGPQGSLVRPTAAVTLGVSWPAGQPEAGDRLKSAGRAEDIVSDSHYAWASPEGDSFVLQRDPLGISPLYYGWNADGHLCFASEVKGLAAQVQQVRELPPGTRLKKGKVSAHYELELKEPVDEPRQAVAAQLRRRLERSVGERAGKGVPFGSWLSGGLDSSVLAALARQHTHAMHTFAAGFEGAPDLEAARVVARHIGSTHHEVIPTFADIVQIIPDVIRHLESFDALLVRSSLMNYLVAKLAADYVPAVFSGEGGDELFAGYSYLKRLGVDELPAELLDITSRMHNTALQRVDRCAAAHGTIAYVGFLDDEVLEYALAIPPEYKIVSGMEKWILRRAVMDLLPERIVMRAKAKFWEGAGVEDHLAAFAEEQVSDRDMQRERHLPNGKMLNTKEELYYYRVFREFFGSANSLDWVGRTKGAPVQ